MQSERKHQEKVLQKATNSAVIMLRVVSTNLSPQMVGRSSFRRFGSTERMARRNGPLCNKEHNSELVFAQ